MWAAGASHPNSAARLAQPVPGTLWKGSGSGRGAALPRCQQQGVLPPPLLIKTREGAERLGGLAGRQRWVRPESSSKFSRRRQQLFEPLDSQENKVCLRSSGEPG